MKKTLNESSVVNELKGKSLHFQPQPVQENRKSEESPAEQPPVMSTSQHVDMTAQQYEYRSTNQQIRKKPSMSLVDGSERLTTYLRQGTIKTIKRMALEEDRTVYEIVQEALDDYLTQRGGG